MGRVQGVVVNGIIWRIFWTCLGNNFRPQMKTSPLVWVKAHHFFLSSWMEGSRVLLSMELFGDFLGKVWENNFRPQK